jgi:leader peptidase (prepilin peptidase)/N-methyltransferase
MSVGSIDDVLEHRARMTAGPEDEAAPANPVLPRHPAVIVALAGFPLLAFATFGFGARGFITAFAAAALVALAAIDIEHGVLPNRILLPAAAVVLVAQVAFFPDRALEWTGAAAAAAAFLALPLIVRRDAMGLGDVKLGLLLGAATGWSVFSAIVIGCLAMLPAAAWILRRDGSIRNATLPFGPFLALGALVVLYTG